MKKRLIIVLAIVMVLSCVFAACVGTTYSVTFDAQNGTEPTVVTFDSNFALPADPTNGDKVFGGWYLDKDCADGNEWKVPTALLGNVTVYAKWTDAVTPDPVTISLNKTTLGLEVGGSETLVATVSDGSSTIWASTDTSVATVDQTGKVTAVAQGTTMIIVTTGSATATCQVTVTASSVVPTPDTTLATILAKYADVDSWNFRTTYVLECDGNYSYNDVLSFDGENFAWKFEEYDEDDNTAVEYTDYVWYDEAKDQYVYYYDNGDGTYSAYYEVDDADDFYELSLEAPYLNLSALADCTFTKDGDFYVAAEAVTVGNDVLAEWQDSTWTEFKLCVDGEHITKIVATLQYSPEDDDATTFTFTLEFSKYGEISITLPEVDDSGDADGGDIGGDDGGSEDPDQGTETVVSIDCTQSPSIFITEEGTYVDKDGKTQTGGTQKTLTGNGITVINDIASSKSAVTVEHDSKGSIRFYAGSNLTIQYTGMKKIVITTDGEKNFKNNITVSGATTTIDGATLTITFAEATDSVTFAIESQVRVTKITITAGSGSGSDSGDSGSDTPDPTPTPAPDNDAELVEIFEKYEDIDDWNFRLKFVLECDGDYSYDDVLKVIGDTFSWEYEYDGKTFVDYVLYDETTQKFVYYYDNSDGTYDAYYQDDEDGLFEYLYASTPYFDLSSLNNYAFTKDGDCYVANDPTVVGNAVWGDGGDDCTFTELKLYVADGYITKITATQEDTFEDYTYTCTFTLEFSQYGEITLTAPDLGGGDSGDDDGGSGSEDPDIPVVESKTIVIDIGSFTLNNSIYGFYNWTEDGISGLAYLYAGNTTSIQMNKTKASYYFASTTATSSAISSITVKLASVQGGTTSYNFEILTSSSAFTDGPGAPTTGNSQGTKTATLDGTTWTISGTDTYFCIVCKGKAAVYIESITVV